MIIEQDVKRKIKIGEGYCDGRRRLGMSKGDKGQMAEEMGEVVR
jgi:hypothetical protein